MSVRSLDCKLYVSTSLLGASPTWVEVKKVGDASLSQDDTMSDMTTRDGGGEVEELDTVRKTTVSAELNYHKTDPAVQMIEDAQKNRTPLAVAVMDGDIETGGNKGWQGNCKVNSKNWNMALREGSKISVSFSPVVTTDTEKPGWKTIAGA